MRKFLKRFNYPNNWISPSVGLSGGISLMWKTGFTLDIVHSTDKMINTIIYSDPSKPEFLATFLYGSTYHNERVEQREYINSIGSQVNLPWVIIGDLNITMFAHERSSNTRPTTSEFPLIQQVIDRSYLNDLGYIGSQFTWSNRQSGIDNVRSRLDRALVISQWLHHYNHSKLFHLDAIGSDHLPILLVTNTTSHQGKRPFRYFKCWFKDPTCQQVIRDAYKLNIRGSHAYRMTNGIRNVKFELKKWNLSHYGNVDHKVSMLTDQLKTLNRNPYSIQNNEAIKEVKHNLELAQKAQESFYAQKSRVEFIKSYDKNTSYYHTSVNRRRHFNHISSLKLPNGQWSKDRNTLEDLLVTHFKTISTSTNPLLDEKFLNCIDASITNGDNDKLLSPITLDEIRNTIKQMGP
ncbi:uncharacterized protein LOC113359715 [Papaver somniferum]|uniref:uncharacterized protein LOC113359715 n=1 Tax=Papaver somniferum TaxID=3469 RepID=UPI000E6FADBB|nr:uncharacterized protein LOC113359715 [Papaver somniferum]